MDTVKERIRSIFETQGYFIEMGEEDVNLLDYGIDSIAFMSIIIELEEEFNCIIPDGVLDFELFKSLNALTSFIETLLQDKGTP
ncbi:MAG: acyl carrier protein [Lachnospiraceae bacterium]|jgi:acyl carrier protein|nr:acyl carrier protein [Lachnospiraceae bacterium]